MQRAKRIPGEERKQLIIEAAMKVFAEKGFQGTKTKDIANAAGVSEAMIFKFFKNKDELYDAIIGSNVKDHSKEITRVQTDVGNFPTMLKSFILHVIKNNEKDPAFLRLMLYSSLEEHKLANNFIESHLLGEVKEFTKVIEDGIETGEYRDVNPKLAAQLFHYLIGGYCIERFVLGKNKNNPFDNEEVAETMVDILLNGLKNKI